MPEQAERQGQAVGMAVLVALAAVGLGARAAWPAETPPAQIVVEVRGAVPAPGFHALVAPATVSDALRAAGAAGDGEEEPVAMGERLSVSASGVERGRTDEALLFGVPLDLNTATAEALETLPGVGAHRAADIVQDRASQGPFATVDELDRVRGIGPATVEKLRPWLEVTR